MYLLIQGQPLINLLSWCLSLIGTQYRIGKEGEEGKKYILADLFSCLCKLSVCSIVNRPFFILFDEASIIPIAC